MSLKRIAVVTAILVAIGGVGAGLLLKDNVHAGNSMTLTGSLEGTEVDVNTKIPGRIVKIYVAEGDYVKAGQVIGKISDDELQAKRAQAQALVDAAKSQLDQANLAVSLQDQINKGNVAKAAGAYEASQAQLQKARNGARSQEIAQAQANYDLWLKTSQRVHNLLSKGAVPAQKVDEVDTQLKVAKETLAMAKEGARAEDIEAAAGMAEAAKASLDQANAGLLQTTVAKLNVTAAKAKYDQALAGLREVDAYLKDTIVKAPITGTVTVLYTDAGELISTGMSVATIVSDTDMWVEVKVKETDLSKVAIHQKVVATLASGKTCPGEILWINRKPDFAAKRATSERDDQDTLAYGVKVKIDLGEAPAVIGETVKVDISR